MIILPERIESGGGGLRTKIMAWSGHRQVVVGVDELI